MNFKNLFFSFFLVVALGLALVHAEESKEPRGPKITNKVRGADGGVQLQLTGMGVCMWINVANWGLWIGVL